MKRSSIKQKRFGNDSVHCSRRRQAGSGELVNAGRSVGDERWPPSPTAAHAHSRFRAAAADLMTSHNVGIVSSSRSGFIPSKFCCQQSLTPWYASPFYLPPLPKILVNGLNNVRDWPKIIFIGTKPYQKLYTMLTSLISSVIMWPSSLGGGRILRRTLSVRLSVCPSVRLSVRPSRYRCHR